MIVPCPTCKVPLSSDNRRRYCIYCTKDYARLPAEKLEGGKVRESFFYDASKGAKCLMGVPAKANAVFLSREGTPLVEGVDYHFSDTEHLVFDVVPNDMDFIVAERVKETA